MRSNSKNHRTRGIRFRLNQREPLIVVRGMVNGKGPFAFAVDTGASMTVISPAVARRAGISLKGTRAKAAGVDGYLDATIVKARSVKIGSLKATNLKVAIVSLALINRSTRLKLGGIIGYNILKRYQVTIDYPTREIFFHAPPIDRRKSLGISNGGMK